MNRSENEFLGQGWEHYLCQYFIPNKPIRSFRKKMDDLEFTLCKVEEILIVPGDFIAKAVEQGIDKPESRGKQAVEMVSRLDHTGQ